ncbi:hypothetical protein [Gloeothece verrucosa]|uniref:Uncharacterized protein n=1 Tax=Gloeothece verrucosa (strain PCC 7822) TaxID=497965 RepID=E0U9I1_GLOV7|nr:hypothetical protein [Gloeothece verrucosa]ADN12673.1 hypothetical protein Cyan7822_0637 [Gloeothece verrucosa PCC 7822]
MTNQPLSEHETTFVAIQLKNGETVKVSIDELEDFWTANADEIKITYGKPRRPRHKTAVATDK